MTKPLLVISSILFFLALGSCDKEDITIYNNYEGNPNDSTGYINIYYTNFEPDIVLDSTIDKYWFDVNNDGDNEFLFEFNNNGYWTVYDDHLMVNSNCFNGNNQSPASLDLGFLIQSNLNPSYHRWFAEDNSRLPFNICSINGTEIFIGMRSEQVIVTNNSVSNSTYARNYGWMQIEVSTDAKTLILKEFAYNLIPNSPIRVGDK